MDQLSFICLVIFSGIFSQILAYRLRLPAIVPLLLIGALLGQFHVIHPEEMGKGLDTIIQIGVAIILFEGGLSLKLRKFKEAPRAIRNLISLGVLITWVLGSLTVYVFIQELQNASGLRIAVLFGALITVSGPTVIVPLLKIVKPTKKLYTILKWEGILVDPIGALLAVVILTFIETSSTGGFVIRAFLSSLSIGVAIGGVGAIILNRMLNSRDLFPESITNLVVLSSVLAIFALSNWLQEETGIVAVTVSGFVLGMLKPKGLREIEIFKGQLTTLMVSILFILLAARLDLQGIWNLGIPGLLVLLSVLFLVRPLNVFVSTHKSLLTFKEKLFLSWIAPRGIVAAAVASLFTDTLSHIPEYASQAGYIESLTFLIIAGTVFFQGASARLIGRLLGVIEPDPNGIIIVGANAPSRKLARQIIDEGIEVFMLDSNSRNISHAIKENIPAQVVNAMSQDVFDEIDLAGYGKLLAMTPSEKANVLVCQLWSHEFGNRNVFRVSVLEDDEEPSEQIGLAGEGQIVFNQEITYEWLQHKLGSSWDIERQKLEKVEDVNNLIGKVEENQVYPLMRVDNKRIYFCTKATQFSEGDVVLFLKKKETD